jgi:hypothetical protein
MKTLIVKLKQGVEEGAFGFLFIFLHFGKPPCESTLEETQFRQKRIISMTMYIEFFLVLFFW